MAGEHVLIVDDERAIRDALRGVLEDEGYRVTTAGSGADATVPPMTIDRTLLRQAVLNLIKNGLEAVSQGGTLTVTTRRLDDTVEIAVTDTGPGISAEDKEKLFQPYSSTKVNGMGLGLSIVQEIVAEHGGTIRVEDNAPRGSRFVVELPVSRAVAPVEV